MLPTQFFSSFVSEPFGIAALLFGAAVMLLLIWILRLEVRLRQLTRGKDGASLERVIRDSLSESKRISESQKTLEEYLTTVENRIRKSVQGVETTRFNPFHGDGSGGNQSFSTVFLTEEGDGVVLTGMHARERMSVYAKPIKKFTSDYELTKEERSLLENKRAKVSRKSVETEMQK